MKMMITVVLHYHHLIVALFLESLPESQSFFYQKQMKTSFFSKLRVKWVKFDQRFKLAFKSSIIILFLIRITIIKTL